MNGDAIAAAIASTSEEVQAVQIAVTLASGRQIAVMVPSDLTERETIDLVSFVVGGLGPELARRRGPARPRILVPSHAARA